MTTLKLFHKDVCIGTITNVAAEDMSEWSGDIELTRDAEPYQKVFDFLADEDNVWDDGTPLPFAEDLLEDWSLEDEEGARTEIPYPVVVDKEVYWHDAQATYASKIFG